MAAEAAAAATAQYGEEGGSSGSGGKGSSGCSARWGPAHLAGVGVADLPLQRNHREAGTAGTGCVLLAGGRQSKSPQPQALTLRPPPTPAGSTHVAQGARPAVVALAGNHVEGIGEAGALLAGAVGAHLALQQWGAHVVHNGTDVYARGDGGVAFRRVFLGSFSNSCCFSFPGQRTVCNTLVTFQARTLALTSQFVPSQPCSQRQPYMPSAFT